MRYAKPAAILRLSPYCGGFAFVCGKCPCEGKRPMTSPPTWIEAGGRPVATSRCLSIIRVLPRDI